MREYKSISWRTRLIKAFLRVAVPIARRSSLTIEQRRSSLERFSRFLTIPANVVSEKFRIDHIPAEWIYFPESKSRRTIFYLHGGGYVMCSVNTHRQLIAKIARAADARVLAIDYRLAPEHPYPAALDDALRAYEWLLKNEVEPENLLIAGDSAGGGLSVCSLVALRDRYIPLPAAAVCLSPWVDFTFSGESVLSKANEEIIIPIKLVDLAVAAYLQGVDPKTSTISPIFADLRGLPPLFIQVGTSEVLLDDAKRLAARAEAGGVEVTLETWHGMVHVWHFFTDFMPEAQEAVDKVGEFARKHVTSSEPFSR